MIKTPMVDGSGILQVEGELISIDYYQANEL